MTELELTAEQQAEADRIYQILRQQTEADLRQLALLLASKPDHRLLGQTEFEVRDRVHQIGAKAVQTALEERKKRGTTVRAAAARTAKATPSSNAGKTKPGSAR